MRGELLQYNIHHDQKEKDAGFISKQLETHLRERFNVLLSTIEYGIADGHLVRQGTKEPFIESIKRGRDIIQELSSNRVDVARENAEVIGFARIDSFLSDPTRPINSKMLSISPEGDEESKYQHNFYDIFTLKERDGKRYVELSRFSSGLTCADYAKRFGYDPKNPPRAETYLADPFEITNVFITPEEIHKSLHIDHAYMDPAEFMREIWTSPFVQALAKRYELKRDARSFNAFLNGTDEVWENMNRRDKGGIYKDYANHSLSYGEIRELEEKEVRQVSTPCPGKSGADINDSPFSVSDFINKDRGYDFDSVGTCVVCNSGPKALGPCAICEKCTVKIEKEEESGFKKN
ncbi:MAG: hypothetical protein Q7R51_02120 [bacterium]|nr:hypothetical protein [bacterium]